MVKIPFSPPDITEEEINEAFSEVDPEFIEIIKEAAENIRLCMKQLDS